MVQTAEAKLQKIVLTITNAASWLRALCGAIGLIRLMARAKIRVAYDSVFALIIIEVFTSQAEKKTL
jgi:hypothetical protein